nr:response regulator [Desulfobulbaceae bacterium]
MAILDADTSILLVDDEKDFVEVLSQRLEVKGFHVEAVYSGQDALDLLSHKSYDAIVMDLSMPGMDGMEALKVIRERRPNMQIIILTGHGTLESGIEAMKRGASDFIEKPVDFDVLVNKIIVAQNKRRELIEKKHTSELMKIMTSKGW